jgi:hypothetical protein
MKGKQVQMKRKVQRREKDSKTIKILKDDKKTQKKENRLR